MWKRSFHLTWPDVTFPDNHTTMKNWIAEHVMPVVKKDPVYQWIAQYKRGPTVKYAVDDAVYSRYRAWRVSFASKKGKTALTPWDVQRWEPLELSDQDARRDFIDETLCSEVDPDDRTVVQAAAPLPSVAAFFEASDNDDDEDMKESAQPALPISTGSDRERSFVTAALPLLSMERRTKRETWILVGFAIATIYGKSVVGRDLFREWSEEAPNYDEAACDKTYMDSKGQVGIGSLTTWLTEDAPAAEAAALLQTLKLKEELRVDIAGEASKPPKPSKGFRMLVELLVARGSELGLKRYGDAVYGAHTTIPGALEKHSEAAAFVNAELAAVDEFHSRPVMASLLTWFETQHHAKFPLLTSGGMSRETIAFQNGQLEIATMKFTDTAKLAVAGGPIPTFWFFDQPYTDVGQATPLWDNLLAVQLAPVEDEKVEAGEDMISVLEALIGRLFHAVGVRDKWSVMPFILGDANTGKSTVLELVSKMFPQGSVSNISANHEKQFGLESLVDARLVLCPDLPDNMAKVLAQTEWQSCISGEFVSVPRKCKVALSVPHWSAPFFWAGNNRPNYRDNSGSASRRLAMFPFEKLVKRRDTMLVPKILSGELVAVMLRCLRAYKDLCARQIGRDFWSFAPQRMCEQKDTSAEETNHFTNFVANGDDYYQCIFDEGSVTPLIALKKAFANHLKFNHPEANVAWNSDYHALRARGYVVERLNVCKLCGKHATKATCGEHFDVRNRKRSTLVRNLQLKTRDAADIEEQPYDIFNQ
jgi:hypothetical protein